MKETGLEKLMKYIERHTKTITIGDAYDEGLRLLEIEKALPDISKPIKEIENAMERWHHARDNDGETLQKINDILVEIGLLGWFNKCQCKESQFTRTVDADFNPTCGKCGRKI